MSRDAYADAFRRITGRPLVALPQLAGASDSEIFFESLALNTGPAAQRQGEPEELLGSYFAELAAAFRARRDQLTRAGRVLPGAREALAALARQPGVIQTVLTGTIKDNAVEKLHAFGLDSYLDIDVGGFGSDVYPKGTQIVRALATAAEKYRVRLGQDRAAYIADSTRDVTAAKVAGVRSVGVATGRATPSELRDCGADEVLDDLADTARVIAAALR